MNNAFLIEEDVFEDESIDSSPLLQERMQQLTDIIEALQHVAGSSYWKVLQQYVFDVDLSKAKKSLAKEKDTTEMFRLQGEIRWGEKFTLENLIEKYRNELQAIRKKINE